MPRLAARRTRRSHAGRDWRDWRASHPQHEAAWQRLCAFDQKLSSLPPALARQTLQTAPANPARRRLLGGVAGGALLGFAFWRLGGGQWQQRLRADYASAIGQTRQFSLPDGSQLNLASASALNIDYNDSARVLRLLQGEILINTRAEPRPLYVAARDGRIQALGTRFSVRQRDADTRVVVLHGAVEIRPQRASHSVRVQAGQALTFDRERLHAPQPASEAAIAWTHGQLLADAMPLGELLQELARYRHGYLHCAPEIAGLKVSGVFPLHDTDRALHNLALALPVEIIWRSRWWVSVQPLVAD